VTLERCKAELTWWLIKHRGVLPVQRWSPIPALTGFIVEQLRWCDQRCYHCQTASYMCFEYMLYSQRIESMLTPDESLWAHAYFCCLCLTTTHHCHPSLLRYFTPGLKPSCFTNPFHLRLPFPSSGLNPLFLVQHQYFWAYPFLFLVLSIFCLTFSSMQ